MRSFLEFRSRGRLVLVALLGAIGLGLVALSPASGQNKGVVQPKQRLEYTTLSVVRTNVVETMNNLAKEGWEVFQVVPNWRISADAGQTELEPTKFEVFAKRPLDPAAK